MSNPFKPQVQAFFDTPTWTVTYVVYDREGGCAAIIDSVLNYDHKSGRIGHTRADEVIAFIKANSLKVQWILETHAHADHLSAAPYLKQHLGGRIGIGAGIDSVQKVFKGLFNLEPEFKTDGSQFDRLFQDEEVFQLGDLQARVMAVPGHTPACVAYAIGDAVFVGDTLFMPDVGTARCDFPGGNAHMLYRSVRKLLSLPAPTRLFMCHDREGISEDDFVKMRSARDAMLEMPTLIMPSVQVNIRAGELPPPEANGMRYLKIPLNAV